MVKQGMKLVRALSVLLVAVSCVAPHAVQAGLRVLYPSPSFALETTAASSDWPGRHVNAVGGTVDLSDAGELLIDVSNRLSRALTVNLSVKSRSLQGRSPGGNVTLPPYGRGRIVCSLQPEPWRLDAPLELVGMKGFPYAPGRHEFSPLHAEGREPRRVRRVPHCGARCQGQAGHGLSGGGLFAFYRPFRAVQTCGMVRKSP